MHHELAAVLVVLDHFSTRADGRTKLRTQPTVRGRSAVFPRKVCARMAVPVSGPDQVTVRSANTSAATPAWRFGAGDCI